MYQQNRDTYLCTNKTFTLCVPISSATLGAAPIITVVRGQLQSIVSNQVAIWLERCTFTPLNDAATSDAEVQARSFLSEINDR